MSDGADKIRSLGGQGAPVVGCKERAPVLMPEGREVPTCSLPQGHEGEHSFILDLPELQEALAPASPSPEPGEARCGTCGSDDPKVCCAPAVDGPVKPHGHPGFATFGCCPDSFHREPAQSEPGEARVFRVKRMDGENIGVYEPAPPTPQGARVDPADVALANQIPARTMAKLSQPVRGALSRILLALSDPPPPTPQSTEARVCTCRVIETVDGPAPDMKTPGCPMHKPASSSPQSTPEDREITPDRVWHMRDGKLVPFVRAESADEARARADAVPTLCVLVAHFRAERDEARAEREQAIHDLNVAMERLRAELEAELERLRGALDLSEDDWDALDDLYAALPNAYTGEDTDAQLAALQRVRSARAALDSASPTTEEPS